VAFFVAKGAVSSLEPGELSAANCKLVYSGLFMFEQFNNKNMRPKRYWLMAQLLACRATIVGSM
jgi:hypothetical protein